MTVISKFGAHYPFIPICLYGLRLEWKGVMRLLGNAIEVLCFLYRFLNFIFSVFEIMLFILLTKKKKIVQDQH